MYDTLLLLSKPLKMSFKSLFWSLFSHPWHWHISQHFKPILRHLHLWFEHPVFHLQTEKWIMDSRTDRRVITALYHEFSSSHIQPKPTGSGSKGGEIGDNFHWRVVQWERKTLCRNTSGVGGSFIESDYCLANKCHLKSAKLLTVIAITLK